MRKKTIIQLLIGALALLLLSAGSVWGASIPSGTQYVLRIHVHPGHRINIDFKGTGKVFLAKGTYDGDDIEAETLKGENVWRGKEGYKSHGSGGWIDVWGNNISAIKVWDNETGDRDIKGVNLTYIPHTLKEVWFMTAKGTQTVSADAYDMSFASLPKRNSNTNSRIYIESPNDDITTDIAEKAGWKVFEVNYSTHATKPFTGQGGGSSYDWANCVRIGLFGVKYKPIKAKIVASATDAKYMCFGASSIWWSKGDQKNEIAMFWPAGNALSGTNSFIFNIAPARGQVLQRVELENTQNPDITMHLSRCPDGFELQAIDCSLARAGFFAPNVESFNVLNNPKLTRLSFGKKLKAIKRINCSHTGVTNLSHFVSRCNPETLEEIYCVKTKIRSLDVSKMQKLFRLAIANNKELTELKLCTNGKGKLRLLSCQGCKIAHIDASNSQSLKKLLCHDNPLLLSLNLYKCENLETLDFANDKRLQVFDARYCKKLTALEFSGYNLKTLRLDYCTGLTDFTLANNQGRLEEVYVNSPKLKNLVVEENANITSLKWKDHGTLENLKCRTNPRLKTLNGAMVYASGAQKLKKVVITKNPLLKEQPHFLRHSLKVVETVDCQENGFEGLFELKGLKALTYLNCKKNALTELSVTDCPKLSRIYAYDNKIESANVSGCSSLKLLSLQGNKLSSTNWDYLICSLPTVTSGEGVLTAHYTNTSAKTVQQANGQNANDKHWLIHDTDKQVLSTSGAHACGHIYVEKVVLNKEFAKISLGEMVQLSATVLPNHASNKAVSWMSLNPTIASVDANGMVRGESEGKAVIQVTTEDKGLTAKCEVTVVKTQVNTVELTPSEKTIAVGGTFKIDYSVEPQDVAVTSAVWKVEPSNGVASVDQEGNVTALKAGTTAVKLRINDSRTAVCQLTVVEAAAVESVAIEPESKTLAVGEAFTLQYTVTPSEATVQSAEWSVEPEGIVTVDEDGKVVAASQGEATVKVLINGAVTGTCAITVTPPAEVETVAIVPESKTLGKGNTFELDYTVTPGNAVVRTAKWTSSNPSIVEVDEDGVVTAKAVGEAEITLQVNGAKSAKCTITVLAEAPTLESVALDPSSKEMEVGDSFKAVIKESPLGAEVIS